MSTMRTDLDSNKKEIIKALESGTPRYELCRLYKCKYDTLKSRLTKWNVEHLKNQSRKGRSHSEIYKPASYYLDNSNINISSHSLKKKLIKDNIKEYKCEICNNTHWNGKLIPLELDHINGDHFDNRLENLRIICPNCHAQTDTNSGKNIGKYASIGEQVYPTDLESVPRGVPVRIRVEAPKCQDCNTVCSRKALRCKSCAAKANNPTKISWPSNEQLLEFLKQKPFSILARELGVSDNAIRKRLKKEHK